jgi:hypothetical protein
MSLFGEAISRESSDGGGGKYLLKTTHTHTHTHTHQKRKKKKKKGKERKGPTAWSPLSEPW